MNYRSKRTVAQGTNAQATKDEGSKVAKKLTFSEVLSTLEVPPKQNDGRWGPFCHTSKVTSHHDIGKDQSSYVPEAPVTKSASIWINPPLEPSKQNLPTEPQAKQSRPTQPTKQSRVGLPRTVGSLHPRVPTGGVAAMETDDVMHTSSMPTSSKDPKANNTKVLQRVFSNPAEIRRSTELSKLARKPLLATNATKRISSLAGHHIAPSVLSKISSSAQYGSVRLPVGIDGHVPTLHPTEGSLAAMETNDVRHTSSMPTSSKVPKANNTTVLQRVSSNTPEISRSTGLSKLARKPLLHNQFGAFLDHTNVAPDAEKSPLRAPDTGFGSANKENELDGSTPFKLRRRSLIPEWPDDVKFDEKEEVLAIDSEGQYHMIHTAIQPRDVWLSTDKKYFVTFNEFCQPLRRGGHVLIKFIGTIAKTEQFCSIRVTNWRSVNAQCKADIIKIIRAHFVIPDGDSYDKGILKRAGKSARQYRYYLKDAFFKPETKTKSQIYDNGPSGHPRNSWIDLVDYWYSEKGEKFAEYGKDARASQNHAHTTGSTSYADVRANFEDENKREPSNLEIFERAHRKKDGTFVKGTDTEDVWADAEAYIQNEIDCNPSNKKSRVQLENEAFDKLMCVSDVSRPLGYGFGVKKSDISGVHRVLRKENFDSGEKNTLVIQKMEKVVTNLTKENKALVEKQEELQMKNDSHAQLLKVMSRQLSQILDAVSSGKAPMEYLNLARNVLHTTNQEVSGSAEDDCSSE